MELFLKATAMLVVTSILSLFLGRFGKDSGALLGLGACCIVGAALVSYVKPVVSFLSEIERACDLGNETFQILLKAVGITFLSEIVGTVCTDAGNASLGKMIQLLSSGTILCLSLPILETLVDILGEIVGKL